MNRFRKLLFDKIGRAGYGNIEKSVRFARVITCASGGVCAVGPRVDTTVLSTAGRDPLRWGADSVAWFEGDGMVIRSIGPGTVRRMLWKRPPAHPRDGSYRGVATTAP